MSKTPENRDARGRIIVDRTYIENTLRKRVVFTCVIAGVFLLSYIAIICFVFLRNGASNPKAMLYFLFLAATFVFIVYPLKDDITVLSAAKNGEISVAEDKVADKYVKSSRRSSTYYVKGTVYGNIQLPSITAKEYREAAEGEIFWIVSVKTEKKNVNCAVFLSSFYTLSSELTMRMQSQPGAADSGIFDGYPACTADSDPVPTAPYTAANDRKVTSHYGESHGKVRCASCGKKFDCHKHGDTCPRCGAVRVK